jgi:hypothetical protein
MSRVSEDLDEVKSKAFDEGAAWLAHNLYEKLIEGDLRGAQQLLEEILDNE